MMICVPLKEKNFSRVLNNIEEANKVGDIFEIWFDEISDLTTQRIRKIISSAKKPCIYKSTGNTEKIKQVLINQIEYIDLDITTPIETLKLVKKLKPKIKIIISYHNFKKTPAINFMKRIIKKMEGKKADIFKIATFANSFDDNLKMFSLLEYLRGKKKKVICLCMGERGKITRTAGHIFGNYLIYAPLNDASKTATGQIVAKELKRIIV